MCQGREAKRRKSLFWREARSATLPPQLLPIHDVNFYSMEGSFGWRAEAPFVFGEDMGHLTLREALASHRLDAFVREQQDDGAELVTGSELERGLALLITQRHSLALEGQFGNQASSYSEHHTR